MRSRGYLRDAPHKRTQKDARHLLARLGAVPTLVASLEQFELPIFDQGGQSSCTGHGTAQLISVALAAIGSPLGFVPSPAGIYCVARCIDRGAPDVALEDVGAMPANVMAGISRWGVHPIGELVDGRNSDVNAANVNREPNLIDLEHDADTLIVGEYRIDETANDVVNQVCMAIAHGYPVGIGAFVDSQFEAWSPGSPLPGAPNDADPNGGGHWMCLTSFRTATNGTRVFRGPNSWGSWGDAGHFECGEGFIRAAWDLYVGSVRRAS